MKTNTCIRNFEKGKTHSPGITESNSEKKWNPHPTFRGVFLKHIILGKQTANRFSSHIVRIEPNGILEEHIHEGKTELHEVLEGNGICMVNGEKLDYEPGYCAVIPDNVRHKVIASKDGLVLLAKFMPALL